MTDTGGGKGLGGGRGRVRRKLRSLGGLGGATGGGGRAVRGAVGGAGGGAGPGGSSDLLRDVVWPQMDEGGVFDDTFSAPELIYFLQQVARLTQKSPRGVEEVTAAFNVRPDSPFSAWQRRVRQAAPDQSSHRSRASQAFQSGSNRWAISLVRHRDPTVFTMTQVVLVLSRHVDEALLASPREILDEYLKLVVDSLISDDPKLEAFSERLHRDYTAQLKEFLQRFDEPSDWTELRIPTTMKSFPKIIRGND